MGTQSLMARPPLASRCYVPELPQARIIVQMINNGTRNNKTRAIPRSKYDPKTCWGRRRDPSERITVRGKDYRHNDAEMHGPGTTFGDKDSEVLSGRAMREPSLFSVTVWYVPLVQAPRQLISAFGALTAAQVDPEKKFIDLDELTGCIKGSTQ
jgi:hypothetical protein